MQQLFNNRYVRLAGLTAGIAALLFVVIWLFCQMTGLSDFPIGLQAVLALLAAGVLVYKFLSQRVF